ncbi:hypothetical protein BGZ99_007539 [Dissophora globulifera]|uniref:Secreted protein n=1 Tax=Dissophora globulifera TaxID=979702 RepID=A0A9P6UQT4_9FUNG|nr:hypothetical protein BGZ99_007539 [Dissophora globulifera]
MARPTSLPRLTTKALFTPSTFVCLLALSLCSTPTATHALPISPSIPRAGRHSNAAISIDSSTNSPSAAAPPLIAPFRTVSRPINIHVDITSGQSVPLARLVEHTERFEQLLRQREQQHRQELARMQLEQDELEKVEQDRDQLLDNEEELLLDQDPATVRRRQEESLGLWMTDSDFEALQEGASTGDDNLAEGVSRQERILLTKNSLYDLYADDFEEVAITPEKEALRDTSTVRSLEQRLGAPSSSSRSRFAASYRLQRLSSPTEEEMLQWPVNNLSQFEDRQDETQDEYDEEA